MHFFLRKTLCFALVCGLLPGTLLASGGELSLNNHSFKLAAAKSMGSNGLELEGSLLHHDERGNMVGLSLMNYGDAGSEGLEAGIGVRFVYIDGEFIDTDGSGVALGGKVHYVPTQYNRLNMGAYAWLGPKVLAFSNVDSFSEVGAYLGYNVIREADVFVGYRHVKAGFTTSPDLSLDSRLHVGIRMSF